MAAPAKVGQPGHPPHIPMRQAWPHIWRWHAEARTVLPPGTWWCHRSEWQGRRPSSGVPGFMGCMHGKLRPHGHALGAHTPPHSPTGYLAMPGACIVWANRKGRWGGCQEILRCKARRLLPRPATGPAQRAAAQARRRQLPDTDDPPAGHPHHHGRTALLRKSKPAASPSHNARRPSSSQTAYTLEQSEPAKSSATS